MKDLRSFALFQALFFTCMWMSKTLHPLFFEQSSQMQNFSFSYSAMAFSGYFSFAIGHYCDRLGYRFSLIIGCLIYGASMWLRIFPDSEAISITSGLLGGLGAAAALSSMRIWMIEISNEKNRTQLVGIKGSMTAFGTAWGCLLAGLLSGKYCGIDMETLLKASGISMMGMGAISILLPTKENQNTTKSKQEYVEMFSFLVSQKKMALGTITIGILSGFYVSFISPYLPVILNEKGFDLTAIGISMGSLALIRFFTDSLVGRWMESKKNKSFRIYIFSEIFVLLTTTAFLCPLNHYGFILLLILRSLGLGFTMISEEITWLKLFPKKSLGLCFGLNQSGFFMGDFFGGLLNGKIFTNFGLQGCAICASLVMILNLIVFFTFFRHHPQTASNQLNFTC